MKAIDMTQHTLVWCGLPWPHARAPSAKEMIGRLERNEAYVSWLQPREGGVDDQFPAIRMRDGFFTLSLRMMKSIWRHIRLKKGFVNRQSIPHIGTILRIPTVLLQEKIRTQERFNVSRAVHAPEGRARLKGRRVRAGDAVQGHHVQVGGGAEARALPRHAVGGPGGRHQAPAPGQNHRLPPR
jgi:hypothetical protein